MDAPTDHAASGWTTFPPDDCGAGLSATDIVHEYVFAEFQPVARRVGELQTFVTLDFPVNKSEVTPSGERPRNSSVWKPALTWSALQVYGGLPLSRAFDEDVSDLAEPLVPLTEVDDVLTLLNERGGLVAYPGGSAKVVLDDDAIADLVAGRETIVRGEKNHEGSVSEVSVGRRSGSWESDGGQGDGGQGDGGQGDGGQGDGARSALLRLRGPVPPTSTVPLQRRYHVGGAEEFIRSPLVAAEDGSSLRLTLTGEELMALHRDGETELDVNGQPITLVVGDSAPVSAAYMLTGESNAGQGLISTETRDGLVGSAGSTPATAPTAVEPIPQGQLQLALYLPWRHIWKLTGYSRGELLHTLALAPQEDVTIEVTSWDRYKRTYEESAESSFEQSRDFTQTDKDSHAVVRDIANGSSFGLSIGGTVGYTSGGFNVTGTNSADARVNLNSSSKVTFDAMSEAVTKSSMKLRLQRQTKVGETSEIGTENKVTRRVHNPNLCHTLKFNYYEVLSQYDVEISFKTAEARLCVLVPTAGLVEDAFTYTNVRYYQSVLERVLLVPALAPGFDAARRLVAQDKLCEARARLAMCDAAKDLHDTSQEDEAKILAQLRTVVDRYDLLASSPRSADLVNIPGSMATWNLSVTDIDKFDRWLYLKAAKVVEPHVFTFLDQLSAMRSSGLTWTSADAARTVEMLAGVDLTSISTTKLRQDDNALLYILKNEFGLSHLWSYLGVPQEAYAVTDGGLMAAITTFRQMVQALGDKKQAGEATDLMAANQAAAAAETAAKETASDLEAADALTRHLNAYRNYYRTAIFQLMPWPEKFEQVLSLYDAMIERQVLGFSGNSLALPVNLDFSKAAKDFFDLLVTNNPELINRRNAQPLSLPTSGVDIENRLGRCTGCEGYIEQVRRLDLKTRRADLSTKRAVARQQRLEAARYRKRLEAHEYGDPVRRPATLRIEQVGEEHQPGHSDTAPALTGTTGQGGTTTSTSTTTPGA